MKADAHPAVGLSAIPPAHGRDQPFVYSWQHEHSCEADLAARLRRLRGRYAVVINAWASWCAPCRAEFPLFAAASVRLGTRVAFLGIDTNDGAPDARSFLAAHPVSYPSYQSSSSQLDSLTAIEGTPTTIFINRAGKVIDVHDGQNESQAALENDIERYALGVSG